MSKYTTQIRFIVEMASKEGQPITKRIEESLPRIFNFEYPIWSETYRRTLEKKIIMHYFNKEICFETVGLWKLYLEERLNLIMPYYNKLYETVSHDFEWLENVDITESYKSTKDNTTTSKDTVKNETSDEGKDTTTNESTDSLSIKGKDTTSNKTIENNTSTGKDTNTGTINTSGTNVANKTDKELTSDLPQANYNNLDYGTGLKEKTGNDNITTTEQISNNNTLDKTLTDKRDTTNDVILDKTQTSTQDSQGKIITDKNNKTVVNATGEVNTTNKIEDTFTKTNKGLNGNKSRTELNLEYRQSLINIDKLIIEELSDLFMLIY